MRASSLYFHFPFCETKCHYCDFYSIAEKKIRTGDPSRFEQALAQEIELRRTEIAPTLDTLFLGGGTPSMTDPASMERALSPLWKIAKLSSEVEWTMEANPSSVSLERLKAYRGIGVNRISMGVQALKDSLLKGLGRVHSADRALQALHEIFESGFENVSVDLLCGVPGQSEKDIEEAVDQLTSFPITHLSCYLLTLPPHHPMFSRLPHEDTQLEHLLLLNRLMTERGFHHYETSNYAKPGKEARHNLAYWKRKSYLGLGPSAHSYDAEGKNRWKNLSSLHRYTQELESGNLPSEGLETLTEKQEELERWMLQLRLKEGFPETWLKTEAQKKRAETFRQSGLLEAASSSHLRLTPRGWALSDQIIPELAPRT